MANKKDTKYFSTTLTDEENAMIEELSSLTGLNKATAVKMHLRQTLPAKLVSLRAESNSSLCNCEHSERQGESQEKNCGIGTPAKPPQGG